MLVCSKNNDKNAPPTGSSSSTRIMAVWDAAAISAACCWTCSDFTGHSFNLSQNIHSRSWSIQYNNMTVDRKFTKSRNKTARSMCDHSAIVQIKTGEHSARRRSRRKYSYILDVHDIHRHIWGRPPPLVRVAATSRRRTFSFISIWLGSLHCRRVREPMRRE